MKWQLMFLTGLWFIACFLTTPHKLLADESFFPGLKALKPYRPKMDFFSRFRDTETKGDFMGELISKFISPQWLYIHPGSDERLDAFRFKKRLFNEMPSIITSENIDYKILRMHPSDNYRYFIIGIGGK